MRTTLCSLVILLAVSSPAYAQSPGELPSNDVIPDQATYVVAKGDTLIDISQAFINHYRYPFIVEEWVDMNSGLDPNRLQPGDRLRVPNLPRIQRVKEMLENPRNPWLNATIEVNVSLKELIVTNLDTSEQKTYPIGTGKSETPTPKGAFVVYEILDDPVFRRSNGSVVRTSRLKQGQLLPMNWPPLISLGLRMESGAIRYRIHSTTDPHTIGDELSNGCIRMNIDDALELRQLMPNPSATGIQTPGRIR